MSKIVLFEIIQFSTSTQFKCKHGSIVKKTFLFQDIQFSISMPLVLLNPLIGRYQVLPHRARVDLGAIAMKGYSVFPKAPPSDCLVSYPGHTLAGVLPVCSGVVSVFYSPSRLGNVVVGVLVNCVLLAFMYDLKATQMNLQCYLVQELMLYESEPPQNATEATKNIC